MSRPSHCPRIPVLVTTRRALCALATPPRHVTSPLHVPQVCLTDQHLAVLMDVALGGNLTSYVSDQYKHAERHGLFLTEVTHTLPDIPKPSARCNLLHRNCKSIT